MTALLSLPVLIGLIAVALAFDLLNGLHDTANSIATIVSTRMLRPRYAVVWAAFFNFIAFLLFGVHVARTIGVGIVSADVMDARVIFGALMGAISWNLITWWAGIPSSSSHALIGGLVGRIFHEFAVTITTAIIMSLIVSLTVTPISESDVGSVQASSLFLVSRLNCQITTSDGTVLSSNTNNAAQTNC